MKLTNRPINRLTNTLRRTCQLAALTVLGLAPLSVPAQVNNPAYADYFLVGRFGEICTMCEAVILCQTADENGAEQTYEAIPESGSFTIYHLQTRTFWSQIATIWEWFIANFNSESLEAGHSRPFIVYKVTDGNWSEPQTVDAQVSLDPALISVGDESIDRVERRWYDGTGSEPTGYCQRLPLWESLDVIAAHSGGEAP